MIRLSEYLGLIFKEVSVARTMADAEAQRVAELYKSDEMLQHFSIPRFKIPEISLNIPLAISDIEVEAIYEFQLKEKQVQDFFHQKFSIKNDIQRYEEIWDFYKKIQKNPSKDYQKNLAYKLTVVHKEFDRVMQSVLLRNRIKIRFSENNPAVRKDYLAQTKQQFQHLVEQSFVVKEQKLKSLLVKPESENIKKECAEHSVFSIQAKLVEEGFTMNTLKDESGNQVNVVHFE